MHRIPLVALLGASLLVLSGCCMQVRICHVQRCCPPQAASEAAPVVPDEKPDPRGRPLPAKKEALYDGTTGAPASLMVAADAWQDADLIAFGELHGDAVGAKHQFALLKALAAQDRPIALAMEFFERDTQAVVDRYLAGEIDAATMKKEARQGRAFDRTHGPLLAFCKDHDIPVIAANAPRRLVSAYRKQEDDFETWKASLPEEDQALLPEDTTVIEDEYRDKFLKLMGPARGPSFFRSQSLWDDAMAEAMVDFRAEHPDHRILFIVGGFHVTKGLGTITKYKMRRGKDDVRILAMTMSKDPALGFTDDDLGAGDLVLKVPYPVRRAAPKKTPKTMPEGHGKAPKHPSP